MQDRSMVKLLHVDGFYPKNEAENIRKCVSTLNFIQKDYGYEIPNFNFIFQNVEIIFNKVLGERVIVDPHKSGVVRRPYHNKIHFEDFNSSSEWCFIIALEPTLINIWYHISDKTMGDLSNSDSKNVFSNENFLNFNFNNLFEWKIQSNIKLDQNEGIFIRPWVFHSLEEGLVQYYRLIADTKFRILVMGYPGSKKKSIATKISKKFESSYVIHSMDERVKASDVDFTTDGQLRHCYRMLSLARESKSQVTVLNMATPLEEMRQILNPDIIIWVSDKTQCQYHELNKIYQLPYAYDVECSDDDDLTIDYILKKILTKRL